MDIHRCRFVPYPASPINALAFSHETGADHLPPENLRLALGRANGDIELWDPCNGVWIQEAVFKGGKGRSIEGLVWTHDLEDEGPDEEKLAGKLRLFSIGYSNTVTEWNLSTGMPLRHCAGSHGEVWCVAAQPRWKHEDGNGSRKNQILATGCADGSIVLQSTDHDDLSYLLSLPRPSSLKARILSLTFKGRDTLIAGCSDSTIWIYDIRGRGRVKHTMSLGAGPRGGSNNILVWALRLVHNDVLVSGDSNGELRFWDLKTATQLQRIKCHDADIHDIGPSRDGLSLLSAGSDRKMCRLQLNQDSGRWHRVSHQRVHLGDVKAMATLEARDLSIVVSGGGDSIPVLTPLRRFGAEYHRSLSSFPIVPPVASAPKERILVSWWDREVSLCCVNADSLRQKIVEETQAGLGVNGAMDKILIQGEETITSVSISPSGSGVLAVGTSIECKLFLARRRRPKNSFPGESTADSIKIRKLEIPQSLARCGARHLEFSPDGKWLLITPDSHLLLLFRLVIDNDSKYGYKVLERPIELYRREHPLTISTSSLRDYQESICRTAWSSDSRLVVCADLSGHLDSWVLKEEGERSKTTNSNAKLGTNGVTNGASNGFHSDSDSSDEEEYIAEDSRIVLGQFWSRLQAELPKLPTFPLILSFRPTTLGLDGMSNGARMPRIEEHLRGPQAPKAVNKTDRLIAVTSLHEIYEFQVLRSGLSDWSRRNSPTSFPAEFLKDKERAMGCLWDTGNGKERLWIYSNIALWMFDMSRDLPPPAGSSDPKPESPSSSIRKPNSSTSSRRKRKRDEDEMSWQGSQNRDTESLRWQAQSSGAGDKILAPSNRHGLGNHIRMTTTDDVESFKQARSLAVDEGSPGEFDDEEDEVDTLGTFSINQRRDLSSALAQYRRDEAARDDPGGELTDGAQANGHLQESPFTNGDGTRGTKLENQQGYGSERSHAEGSDKTKDQVNTKEMQIVSPEVDKSPDEHPHFWRTYKYRPILGIVPLEKTENEAMAGVEDDEIIPDLEVALIERPLWETDLDLPWASHL